MLKMNWSHSINSLKKNFEFRIMKKILFIIFSLFLNYGQVRAQELPLFTQYREFQSFMNPAAVPVDNLSQTYEAKRTLGVSYRSQWIGYKGGPVTMTARYEHISNKLNSIFGGNIIQDETGRFGRSGIYGRYAYQIKYADGGAINVGAKFGVFQNRYSKDDAILRDAGDVTGETNLNQITPDFGLGIYWNQRFGDADIVYGGFSIPQFANFFGGVSDNGRLDFLYEATHLYFNAGLYKGLGFTSDYGEREMYIEPSAWVKYVAGAPIQTDVNIRVHLPDLFWLGTGYGFGFSDGIEGNFLHLEGGIVLDDAFNLYDKSFKLGIGYDNFFGNNAFAGFGSSFEINLNYSWK